MKLPKHKGPLYLTHNEHKNSYEDLKDWLRDMDCYWLDSESERRAIETDEIWTLQWYPGFPCGFREIAAPTLKELLELAKEIER